jgi:hypothetical protein
MFSLFKKKQPHEQLQEFSANFESDWVRPFLERIVPFFESGFATPQVDQVCQVVATLPHDQKRPFSFRFDVLAKAAFFAFTFSWMTSMPQIFISLRQSS